MKSTINEKIVVVFSLDAWFVKAPALKKTDGDCCCVKFETSEFKPSKAFVLY